MRKLIKRATVLLLVAILAAASVLSAIAARSGSGGGASAPPATPAPVQGSAQDGFAGASETDMAAALIPVKSLLGIDDEVYTEFNYSSSFSNQETREGLVWSFYWSDAEGGSINAVAQGDGTLLQYWKYDAERNGYFGFAEYGREDAVSIADEFIKKAKPDTFSYYQTPETVNVSLHDGEYRLEYYAQINGYEFQVAYAGLSVNKFTGEVTQYNTGNVNPKNYSFENADGIIGESEAIKAYADKIGLSLEYRAHMNYEDGTIKLYPVYFLSSGGDEYIGAKSGEIVEYVYDLGSYDTGETGNAMPTPAPAAAEQDAARGGYDYSSLSAAEIAAIEKASSFLTNEQALQKLLAAAELAESDAAPLTDRNINLYRDHFNKDKYYYQINLYSGAHGPETRDNDLTGVYGTVDAVSGRVTSFSLNYNGAPVSDGTEYTDAQASAAVEAFLEKNAPDELEKSKKEENRTGGAEPYSWRGNWRGDNYFEYTRYENDIPFTGNGISVTYNMYTGKITNYNLNWYENITFPSVANVLTAENALLKYVGFSGCEIHYITTGDANAALVYDFGNASIEPFTGESLDYTGEPSRDDAVLPEYDDVAGHWSESVVRKLVDNGVYLWSGKFLPDKVMNEAEFLQYLLLLESSYIPIDDAVMFFEERGIDIEADPQKELTRQEAVRIIIEYLGYKKIAQQSQWFVYPFEDEADETYKGYITMCYMLDIIEGSNGRFNAAQKITRAQAAVILTNLIELKSETV